ncbi:hypothetical protein [Actinotalea sp. JY-7876]|uniref:hypothetical protein n=1 Tax=Actinotalea sp. JY-7876 TaxID=2758442 RepID=UPI002103565C|nr:hypothetical protein [Actinotalea sp. JY-7876]
MGAFGDLLARLTGRSAQPSPPPGPTVPAVPTAADLLAALDRVEALVADGAVPGPVASRVGRVVRVVRDAVPRLERLGAGSETAYVVMATATDYLPEAVTSYLRLPREWANSRPVDNGRTSLMVLIDQLDLLGRTMDQVLDAVNRSDAAALVAHGRFLTEKFGHASSGGALDVGTGGGTPGPDGADDGRLRPPGSVA